MDGLAWLHACGSIVSAQVPLAIALLLAGLGSSVTHCVTMCSPFVLGQAAGVADKGVLVRLLLPYHAGRAATYAALGAVAGGGVHLAFAGSQFTLFRHVMLAITATLFLALFAERFLGRVGVRLPMARMSTPSCAVKAIARIRSANGPMHRFGLGVAMGLLPCPMIMAALFAVAASGNAASGALGMAAFAAGTSVALMGLSVSGGHFLKQSPRLRDGLGLAALGINGVILLGLAIG